MSQRRDQTPDISDLGWSSGHPRGVRPGMHEPDHLWWWVFDQHQVWVDRRGAEHEIECMPLDYVRNVVGFCHARAAVIRELVELDVIITVYESLVRDERDVAEELYEMLREERAVADAEWLEQTPLLCALRRRLDGHRSQRPHGDGGA